MMRWVWVGWELEGGKPAACAEFECGDPNPGALSFFWLPDGAPLLNGGSDVHWPGTETYGNTEGIPSRHDALRREGLHFPLTARSQLIPPPAFRTTL